MSKWPFYWLATLLITILFLGCSGGSNPFSPVVDQEPAQELTAQTDQSVQSDANLWGYYELFFDMESKTIKTIPCRSTEFSANVVNFLNNDPMGVQVSLNGTFPGAGYVDVDMDVTIKHPLLDPGFNGYDVRGIFVGEGSGMMAYNQDLLYPDAGGDQILLNADGYSRWFNPAEFAVSGLFGYTAGKLAPPGYSATATLNPYKYFGDGIGNDQNLWDYLNSGNPQTGYFLAGTSNTRDYKIRFPIPLPGIKYGYAVVADWSGTAPQFHPSHASESVGVKVDDNSNLWFADSTHNGGNFKLDISVFDWDAELTGGVMEDYSVKIESTVLSTVYTLDAAEMTPTDNGDHWYKYHVEIPADNVNGTVGNEMWVIVEEPIADYTNPLGVPNTADTDKLAACFRYPLAVSGEEPLWIQVTSPNGGEQWKAGTSHDITWDADASIANVKIELSLNSGSDFTMVIAPSTPDTGVFTWDSVPFGIDSNTCRVRISDADCPDVFDMSDGDFEIFQPWIRVTSPNGGEELEGYMSWEITWECSETGGTVNLDYSKDDFAADFHTIAMNTPNDGSHVWENIPLDLSDAVSMRIMCPSPPLSDVSDSYFSIVEPPPFVRVLTPNGGEQWGCGSSKEITWWSYNPSGNVDLYYSKDDFVSDNNLIAEDVPIEDSYEWFVPADLSDTVRVKITPVDFPLGFDVSDNDFSIIDGGWARTWGDSTFDFFRAVVTDAIGNSFVVGDAVDNGNGYTLAVLGKYDPAGQLEWNITWGNEESQKACSAKAIAIDDSDYLYVAGDFRGDTDFDPGTGSDIHSSNGETDIFLSKFDSDGTWYWTKTWGGTGYDMGIAVAVRQSKVYVAGEFSGLDVDFNPDPASTESWSSNGGGDAFLSWFDTSGNFDEARTWGGADQDLVYDLAVDDTGIVFAAGVFMGSDVNFDQEYGTILKSSNGSEDTFLCWFEDWSNLLGVETWGGADWDRGYAVDVDDLGNVYVTGSFKGADVDFDPGDGTDLRSSAGQSDAFLSKFDSSVSYQWVRAWGGTSVDYSYNVCTDWLGNVFTAGTFYSSDMDFDPGPGSDSHSSSGWDDAYLSMFDSSGNYVMARIWGGTDYDEAYGLDVSDTGAIFVTGFFYSSSMEFAPVGAPCFEDSDIHYSLGNEDAFLVKYMPDGCW